MSVIRPELHSSLAAQIQSDIQFLRANIFYYLGKIEPWADEEVPPLEPPPTAESDIETRNNIVYLKKINPADVSIVVPRYSWEMGTVFTEWNHTQDMTKTQFYCVTSDFNVYKCLDNNGGAPSTVVPTNTSTLPFRTIDGYLWKYMYNIPPFKQNKFVSGDWIPVQKSLTDAFYSKGAVEQVSIISEGSGYTDTLQTTINVVDATGANAILIPSVSRLTGEIVKVTIVEGGENYSSNPTLNIIQATQTGSGKYNNNPSAILKAIVQNGVIVNVTIEDPGKNYPTDLDTSIIVQGDGDGAAFTPVVYNGQIIDVVIDNPGLNYTFIEFVISGNGEGANIDAVIAASDFLSDQSLIEQVTVPGAIYNIKVTSNGTGYTPSTVVQISGDGEGATAYPVVGPSGSIQKIVVTNPGSGYSNVNITITDTNRVGGITYVDATAYAILPPIMGHGFDAVNELYADTVLIYTLIKDDDQITLLAQDYRQYGLIKNPLSLITNQRITSTTSTVTFDLLFADATGISPDDTIISNNVKYKVVSVNANIVKLQQRSPIYKQPGALFTLEDNPNLQYPVSRVISIPSANKYSGNLMYVTNNPPLSTTADQAFAIRTYIRL